ncbi:MAG: DNA-processing protein DprA [Elusimicrobiota bacterium]
MICAPIRSLGREDADYPPLLSSIADPPETLFARGAVPSTLRTLAIVGTRRPTPYGRRTARRLARECAQAGITVVSGLARGIDTEAHRGVLEAGGITWAVLGSGLDRVYPEDNITLAGEIAASGGAVLSEYPADQAPHAGQFPRRNRIISGLSLGVVVVEGDLRSGALITARAALAQGREVFAVPGPADSPMSEGPLELLRQGAAMARSLEDVLQELPQLATAAGASAAAPEARDPVPHTLDEKKILELLRSGGVGFGELLAGTGWEPARLVATISELERRGEVSALPGQNYARN